MSNNIDKDINKNFKDFVKKYENKECKEIYYLKNPPFPYILQIKQLKKYLEFQQKLDDDLSKITNDNKSMNQKTKIYQNKFYLIDEEWINNWKKHIGYTEIKRNIQTKYKDKELKSIDFYKNFAPIIKKYSFRNSLFPLNNQNIYNEKGIDPLANFEIINKECYDLFKLGGIKKKENIEKTFPIKIGKEQYMIVLNENTFYIAFKEGKTYKIYWEILPFFPLRFVLNGNREKKIRQYSVGLVLVLRYSFFVGRMMTKAYNGRDG